mmetsp:Transcript_1934/g.3541  ORF Transcript_1934/g.3541 Transcript_1934/m.3541 type:complete len:100 (-) Transcript_1934:1143-1442(-)
MSAGTVLRDAWDAKVALLGVEMTQEAPSATFCILAASPPPKPDWPLDGCNFRRDGRDAATYGCPAPRGEAGDARGPLRVNDRDRAQLFCSQLTGSAGCS